MAVYLHTVAWRNWVNCMLDLRPSRAVHLRALAALYIAKGNNHYKRRSSSEKLCGCLLNVFHPYGVFFLLVDNCLSLCNGEEDDERLNCACGDLMNKYYLYDDQAIFASVLAVWYTCVHAAVTRQA